MVPVRLLTRIPLFQELTEEELEKMAELCREEVFEAGTILYEEGDLVDTLYIVERGKVALDIAVRLGPWGARRQRVVQYVTSGQIFGYSGVVEPHVMKLGIRCVEPCVLIAIHGPTLRELFETNPHIGSKVMFGLAETIASHLVDVRETMRQLLSERETAQEYAPEEAALTGRIRYFTHLRWLAAFGVVLMTLLVNRGFHISFPAEPVYMTAVGIAAYNVLFWLWTKSLAGRQDTFAAIHDIRKLAYAQSLADLVAITILLHFTGGIENPFIIYYIFHVIIASLLLSRRSAPVLATLAVSLLALLVGLEYLGIIPHVHLEGFTDPGLYREWHYVLGVLAAFTTTMYVVSYAATWTIAELRHRQRDVVSLRNELLARTQALEKTNEELLRLDRLRTQFVAMASHDLKAPINAVESYLQVLLGGFVGELVERQKGMLERSSQRLKELIQLIDDFVDVSRIESGQLVQEFETTSLAKVAESSLEDVRSLCAEKEMDLRVEIPQRICEIEGCPRRLRQVLTNLLSNAIKFTPERGTITLRLMEEDTHIQVEVTDTGIGIPREDLPRIFEEFYRGRNVGTQGAGLGLAIAKRIVEAHGGTIWAESPYAKGQRGSKFLFALPKSSEVTQDR